MPRMIVINQMDKENANFDKALEALKEKFGVDVDAPAETTESVEG